MSAAGALTPGELRLGRDLAPEDLPETDLEFLRRLGRPTLLHVPGRDSSRCRVVSTLLHGNEPSGLRAMLRYLRDGHQPAVDALFFVGAVSTALADPPFGHRALPGAIDLNRCWRPPFAGVEGAMARDVLDRIRAARPESLIDLHNNTGHNPVYGVAFRADAAELALVALFGERVVHTPIRLGTLVEATIDDFPSVTVECGRAGDPGADEAAWSGLCRYLDAQEIDPSRPRVAVRRYVSPVRIEIRPDVELVFGEEKDATAALTVSQDVDRHNFEPLAVGTPIGWLREDAPWPFEAVGADGNDCSRELLDVEDGVVRSRCSFVPIMMTTDRRIAKSDCLFYAVQPET